MARKGTFQVTGVKELDRKLKGLSKPSTARAVMRPALNKGLTPINRRAKKNAPVQDATEALPFKNKLLKKAIGKKVAKGKAPGTLVGLVGVRTGKEETKTIDGKSVTKNPARYGWVVEAKLKFLKRAMDSERSTALGIIAKEVDRQIARRARKGKL